MAYEQREGREGGRGEGRSEGGERGERSGGGGAGGKRPFFKRRKTCPFTGPNAPQIDWKDVRQMSRFISERGKIMPARITAVCNKKQRELAQAIKRARYMALMPYVRQESDGSGHSSHGQR